MSLLDRRTVIISTLFNIYWFLCIFIQDSAITVLLAVYIAAVFYDKTVLVGSLMISVPGILVDSLLAYAGVFSFPELAISPYIQNLSAIPLWLYFLWLGFASYLWLMRALLFKYPYVVISAVFSLSGTGSYYTAHKLGVVDFPIDLFITLSLLLVIWAFFGCLFSFLIRYASKHMQSNKAQNLFVNIRY